MCLDPILLRPQNYQNVAIKACAGSGKIALNALPSNRDFALEMPAFSLQSALLFPGPL